MATKKCKYCQTEIDKKAKVCPNCKRTLKSHIGLYIFLCLIIFICVGVVATLNTSTVIENSSASSNSELITLEEFNQIQNGMTYDEVVKIIGSNGTLSSETSISGYTTAIYTWYGNTLTGANANVTFQGGKVIGKAQVGLN